MVRAERYRGYAEACFRVAQTVGDNTERGRWIDMAQQWLQWAQDEEAGHSEPARPEKDQTGVHPSHGASGQVGLR